MEPTQNSQHKPLVFAHIGDLHITNAKEKNYTDFLSLLVQLELTGSRQLDFIFLPGDIADQGGRDQYQLVATALKILSKPVHMIGGDHDMEEGSLDNFYHYLPSEKLPKSVTIQGVRCLFLDVNGPGTGGPDFQLGNEQMSWLSDELSKTNPGDNIALFMHTYPADLVIESEKRALTDLISKYKVALVDMGHTHYNELANDGTTIYAATRSTGQIEEGAVGYSLISIDNGVVSWRFKELDSAFPFILITSPADLRLVRREDQKVNQSAQVRAVIFHTHDIKEVFGWTNNGEKVRLAADKNELWTADIPVPDASDVILYVEAKDVSGRIGRSEIRLATKQSSLPDRNICGSDEASIGAWENNGILGTQLGPNRNAKPIKKIKKAS